MAVQKVLLLGCFLFVVCAVNAASKDENLHTSLYRLAEENIVKKDNRSLPRLSTIKTTPTFISTRATTLKPVYIPPAFTVKPSDESMPDKVVEEITKSTTSEQSANTRRHDPAVLDPMTNSNHSNNRINEFLFSDVEKNEHVKSKANPKHEETAHTATQPADQRQPNQTEVAEQKSGMFASATLVPFLASVGTALAIGGLAFYAYPVPAEVTARSDRLNPGSFDSGVRIVQSSDLTSQELRRLMSAEAYHVSARSSTDERKPHPYIDLAKRVIQYATPVYEYLAPSFLGGNSEEEDTGNEYDLGRIQSRPPFIDPGNTNRLIQPIYNGGHQNIGQPNIGQYFIGQPNIGQNIPVQPNVGQHFHGQQNIGQPNIGQHIFGQPNVGQHVIRQQNIVHPNVGQHVIGQQNIVPPNVGELLYNN